MIRFPMLVSFHISFFLLLMFIASLPCSAYANVSINSVSVISFGAIPGDGKDDSYAIQDAINKAAGKAIQVPKGVYLISKTITIPSNTSIIAESGAILTSNGLLSGEINTDFDGKRYKSNSIIYSKSASHIQISNLTIDVNKPVQKSRNVSAIYLDDCNNVLLKSVTAKNNKMLDASKGSGLIFLDRCKNSNVLNCINDNIDVEGLLLRNCSNVTVKGGSYKNSSSSCVATQYGDKIIFDDITAYNASNAVVSINSNDSKLLNSKVHTSYTFFPINLGHRTSFDTRKPANNCIVSNCTVYNGYQGGIHIGYGKNILIEKNEVFNCNGAFSKNDRKVLNAGISSYWWADNVKIIKNKIYNNMKGIKLRFGRNDLDNKDFTKGNSLVQENVIYDNKFTGIEISTAAVITLENNTLYNNNIVYRPNCAEIFLIFDKKELGGDISVASNTIGQVGRGDTRVIGVYINFLDKALRLDKPVKIKNNKITSVSSIKSNYIAHPDLIVSNK